MEERYRPNMFTYSPDDRKVKAKQPLFSFAKGLKERTPSPDRRKALYISYKWTKKIAPEIAILPEHEITDTELLKEFEQTRMGPTSYRISHRITERRADIGIVKIREPIVEEKEEEIDERPELNPNYDFDKPNKLVFQYHEPSTGLGPQHTPTKDRHPEKWKYYDYDLDVVREEVGKEIAFARGVTLEHFKEKEDFYELLVEHNRR